MPKINPVLVVGLLCAMPLLATCGGGGASEDPSEQHGPTVHRLEPGAGLEFMQVDFEFPEVASHDSHWGRLVIDPDAVARHTGLAEGYLVIVTGLGRATPIIPLPPPGYPSIAVYFDLGVPSGQDLQELAVDAMYSDEPIADVRPYLDPFLVFPVGTWLWNAEGAYPSFALDPGDPPPSVPLDQVVPFGQQTYARYQAVTNVQCAHCQCVPMALANCFQFLEDTGAIAIPHAHALGRDGDNTLVGQLDYDCDRWSSSRSSGEGLAMTPSVDGAFLYFRLNSLLGSLTHRHQGRGAGPSPTYSLPAGDYTANGATTEDDGVSATWDWLDQRVADGCAVMAIFGYYDWTGTRNGGHAVRVTGTGMLKGQRWVRYSHDALQTDLDKNDTQGLENVLVYPEDIDHDGMLNFGGGDRELEFLWAHCP